MPEKEEGMCSAVAKSMREFAVVDNVSSSLSSLVIHLPSILIPSHNQGMALTSMWWGAEAI